MSSELDTLTKGDLKSQLGGTGPNMTSSPNQAFQQESTQSTWESHGTPRWEFEESAETIKPTGNEKNEGSTTIESSKSMDIVAEVKHHPYDETSSSFLGEVSQSIGQATMNNLVSF